MASLTVICLPEARGNTSFTHSTVCTVGCLVAKSCLTLVTPDCSLLLRPWDSPGKNTGVGCHFLLQGIFLTHGSNPCFLH